MEEKQLSWNTIGVLLVGRSCVSAGFALAGLTSFDLLLKITKNDSVKARRTLALVESLSTFISFMINPLIGAWMDSFGRKPALIFGIMLSAFARGYVALKPSTLNYIIYRTLNTIASVPIASAISAFLADCLGKPGTYNYIRTSKAMWMFLALVRIGFVRVASSSRFRGRETDAFLLASSLSVVAAIVLSLGLKESLDPSQRRQLNLKKSASPFSAFEFFIRSKENRLIASGILLRAIPMYNYSSDLLTREKYKWTIKERSWITQCSNAAEVLCPLISVPITQAIGQERVLIWAHRINAIVSANSFYTPYPLISYSINPFLTQIFDGDSAMDSLISRSFKQEGIGETTSNVQTLRFPLGLVCPTIFSELYGFSKSYPYLLCIALHLACAEVLLPKVIDSVRAWEQKQEQQKQQQQQLENESE